MCWQTFPEYGGLSWSVVDIPSVTPMMEIDFPSPSSFLARGGTLLPTFPSPCWDLYMGGHSLCEFMCAWPLLNLENVVSPSLAFRTFLLLLHRFPSLEGRGMAKTCHLGPSVPKSLTVYTLLLSSSWFLLTLFGSKFINYPNLIKRPNE